MAKAKKSKKERAKKYDPKLVINGSFEDVIKVSVSNLPEKKPEPKKTIKKI